MSTVLELPGQVTEGIGSLQKLPEMLKERGLKQAGILAAPFAVQTEEGRSLLQKLSREGIAYSVFTGITGEPAFSHLVRACRETELIKGDVLVAIGGGSVIDTGKLLCAMAGNPDFAGVIEDIQSGGTAGGIDAGSLGDFIHTRGLPLFAAPTTAGTGAEATPNAILFEERQRKKIGIVSRKMIADTVILDAALTRSLPPVLAACTGFDALAHAMESFTSKKADYRTETFAVEAMRLIFENLLPACKEKSDEARQRLLTASFYAGVCLTASSTHLVHAMAYPLAERFHVPHGKGIAALLAAGMRECAGERAGEILDRCVSVEYQEAAHSKAGREEDARSAEGLYRILKGMGDELGIDTSLGRLGAAREDCAQMAEEAVENKRLFANCPVDLTISEVTALYEALL